jgi:hypothetical protein
MEDATMIAMITALMLLSGQAAAPSSATPDESAKVDSVIVTAAGKKAVLPRWSAQVHAIGWPFLGLGADKGVMMFAKTDGRPPSPYQRVFVRHEFREQQTETGAAVPVAYFSERLEQEVDCAMGAFRSLAAYRYPKNDLAGVPAAFDFEERAWVRPEPGTFDETVVEAACLTPAQFAVR